jgi:hypothetical protein
MGALLARVVGTSLRAQFKRGGGSAKARHPSLAFNHPE